MCQRATRAPNLSLIGRGGLFAIAYGIKALWTMDFKIVTRDLRTIAMAASLSPASDKSIGPWRSTRANACSVLTAGLADRIAAGEGVYPPACAAAREEEHYHLVTSRRQGGEGIVQKLKKTTREETNGIFAPITS